MSCHRQTRNCDHGRRKILHSNVTEHPTGHWIVQHLRETFREACPYRYVILDRDAKFGKEVTDLRPDSSDPDTADNCHICPLPAISFLPRRAC
jgi:hypothetical protein